MKWYARMIYPYEQGSTALGHYDLQLVGTYTYDDVTYTDPVFSYGGGDGVGYLDVFNMSISKWVYTKELPFKGYHYKEKSSSTDAQYQAFLKLIAGSINIDSKKARSITNSSGKKVGTAYRYKVTSSYKDYDKATRNCFKAVGLWVSALGDSRFTDFAATHPYTQYTAYAMVHNYPSFWQLIGTYT